MTTSWCVAYTQPQKELLATQQLRVQGYDVYFPIFQKTRRHARKVDTVLTALFPRYVFVGFDMDHQSWRQINGTRGVVHVLMNNETTPAKIPDHVLQNLKNQETFEGILPISSLSTFVKGQQVRIRDGVFQDTLATFETLDEKGRVQVLLTFMGRDMRLIFPEYELEAV